MMERCHLRGRSHAFESMAPFILRRCLRKLSLKDFEKDRDSRGSLCPRTLGVFASRIVRD